MSTQRYFFDQDESSHWYMIPEEKRVRWEALNEKADEMEAEGKETFVEDCYADIENEFSEYRLDGGIRYYSFTDPSLTK
jgi:hypothetical protein